VENAVLIRPVDSVVTVTEAVPKGGEVRYPGCAAAITSLEDIPIYHKIAVADIKQGDDVFKYGEKIGVATKDIHIGEHVHTQNVASVRA
jgi:altronate dehydratase small subunit